MNRKVDVSMRYKCIIRDTLDLWLTEGKVYNGEPVIPPLTKEDSWIKVFVADDGLPAFVRAKQMQRVFDGSDDLNV